MNYRDKFYSKYVSGHASHLYGEATLSDIKKQFPVWQKYFNGFLPKDKNAKIIDIGCGNGGFVWWLQDVGYFDASGIDISLEQVECAENLGIKNIERANLSDFLSDKVEFYDAIFLRDVLEHFNKNEILDILGLIYKSLKKGGKIIAQVPNAENLLAGRLRYGDFTHELAFTKESIAQILSISGFKEINVYPQRPVVHGIKSFIRHFLWKCVEHCLRFYLLVETGSSKGIFTQNLIICARK